MRMTAIFVMSAIAATALATPAEAKHHHKHGHYSHHHKVVRQKVAAAPVVGACVYTNEGRTICSGAAASSSEGFAVEVPRTRTRAVYDANYNEGVVAHPTGCPWRQFCGCGASVEVFGHPVRELYLAANWRRFPSASPAPGMAAWRWGHVFVIRSVNGDGTVVAYDANSGGHLTRVHTVSLRGYHVVDPHGSRVARL